MKTKLQAHHLGKKIYTFDNPIQEFDESLLANRLKSISKLNALHELASLSDSLFHESIDLPLYNDVPYHQFLLNQANIFVIKYCADENLNELSPADIVFLLQMCHKLIETNIIETTLEPDEILLQHAYQLFLYQDVNFYHIVRSVHLFLNLWHQVPEAQIINIQDAIESIVGVSYEKIIFFSFAIVGSRKPHFYHYDDAILINSNESYKINISSEDHREFLNWCSSNYRGILEYTGSVDALTKYPIINTGSKPNGSHVAYIVANKKGLFAKITNSIYYTLIEKYNRGNGENPFKDAFGLVFERYVGDLLKAHFKTWKIYPEVIYGKENNRSIDWFVIKGDDLIIIEVKQSSIFVKAKSTGNLALARENLKGTVTKGVRQIQKTVNLIKSPQYNEFKKFKNVKNIQGLVVVYDSLFFANSIGREIIKKDQECEVPFNTISISNLEEFLVSQSECENMFNVLENKSSDQRLYKMEFNEYLLGVYQNNPEPQFLRDIYDDFFSSLKK